MLRRIALPLGQRLLPSDGAFDRVDDALELDENAVAHRLDHVAPMAADDRLDQGRARIGEPLESRPRRRP